MPYATVDDLTMYYEEHGVPDGPPLVLLHGVLGDSRDWRRQLEGLSDEFTVVAWDAPGCGESSDPDPPETFGADVYADCLAEFIEALEVERPHVLGLSWGGGLALELYRRRPDLPRSLVLASAYAGWAVPCRPTRWPDVRSRRCEKLTCRRSNSCRAGCRPCLRKRYHRSWSTKSWRSCRTSIRQATGQ